MPTITVYITEDMKARLAAIRPRINVSATLSKALLKEVRRRERENNAHHDRYDPTSSPT